MSSFKDGINRTFPEEIDENPRCSHDHDMLIPKTQGGSRGNPENYHWEKTS